MSGPETFFGRYRAALAAGDAAAAAAAYRYPLPVIRPDRVRVVPDVETMRTEIARILDFYRWCGMADVAMTAFRVDGFPVGLDMVSLAWRPLTADGNAIATIDVTYALRRTAQGARIAAVIAHNEERHRTPIIREALGALGVETKARAVGKEDPT